MLEEGSHPDLRWPNFSRLGNQVQRFYEQAGYRPVWLREGEPSPQASQLMELLQQSYRKGLNPRDYDGDRWADRLLKLAAAPEPTASCEAALFDLGLTVSAMRYVKDLRFGRIDPKTLNIGLDINGKQFDMPAFIAELSRSDDVVRQAATVEPAFELYWALQSALERYRELAKDASLSDPLPDGATVRPGDAYPGLNALTQRLQRLGDLPGEDARKVRRDVYSEPLVGAVKRFQRRHGTAPDGVLGKQTFQRLNTPMSDRVKQIELTLERTRWLPNDLGHRPIIVNVPEYRLYALEKEGADGQYRMALNMRVIVGEAYPRHQTPLFQGKMRYVVFAPFWNVPYSIVRREFYPKIQKDPSFLSRHHYEIVERFDPRAPALEPTGENIAKLLSGELRLRQPPGKDNALGEVQFLFPNEHSVYLHGTPTKHLFLRDKRDFSHGCIRVQDAPRLAEYVLSEEAGWSRAQVDQLVASGDRRQAILSQPLDVYILYGTAIVDRDSQEVYFFDDIYGHDTKLEQALAAVYH